MSKNSQTTTVAAADPRSMLISKLDADIINATARNHELAAMRKQLDLETEANDEAIRIAQAAIEEARASLDRSFAMAQAESA